VRLAPLDLAKSASAGIFGAVSVLRGGRSLHPNGMAFRARIEIDPEPPGLRSSPLLHRARTLTGVVRLSRSLGLPEALPDIYGLALRVEDAHGRGRHQDLMFTTGGENALARHVPFLFARGFAGRTLSTVLPYRIGARRWVFLARAEEAGDPLRTLAEATRAAGRGALAFELSVAPVLGGAPRRLGRVVLEEALPREEEGALAFTIDHAGGGIEPVGAINALRPAAYRASQAARRLERPRASGSERRAERAAA
jgi:hypothetical protein